MVRDRVRSRGDDFGLRGRNTSELGPDQEITLQRVAGLAFWLDDRFRIPGTRRRVGLDGLLGLLPGIGDTATTLIAAYIVVEAARLGVPKRTLARMLANVGVDYLIGLVPLAGDLADFAWKANRRNARLLREHQLSDRAGSPPPSLNGYRGRPSWALDRVADRREATAELVSCSIDSATCLPAGHPKRGRPATALRNASSPRRR